MNQYLVVHVCAELVVVGGITLFFMKKHKQQETSIRTLEEKMIRYEEKIKTLERSIETLYQSVEGLSEQLYAQPKAIPAFQPTTNLRNRKSKMKVVTMPAEESEEDDTNFDPFAHSRDYPPNERFQMQMNAPNISLSSMMPMMTSILPSILPVDAIFGMMSGSSSPLDKLDKEPAKVSVEIEDEDVTGIEEELASLNTVKNETNSTSNQPVSVQN